MVSGSDVESKMRRRDRSGNSGLVVSLSPCLPVFRHLALLGIGLFFGLPFYWLVSTVAQAGHADLRACRPCGCRIRPSGPTSRARSSYIPFLLYTWNTLMICVLNVIGTVLSCSLVAYSLAKIRWRGRDLVFLLAAGDDDAAGSGDDDSDLRHLQGARLDRHFLPLSCPAFFGSAFNIFLLRQFFMTIPSRAFRRRAHRRLHRVRHLSAGGAAARQARARHGGALHLHWYLERLPGAAALSERRAFLHPLARPAAFCKPARGGVGAC